MLYVLLYILIFIQACVIAYGYRNWLKGHKKPVYDGELVVYHVGDEGGKRFSLEFNDDQDPYDADQKTSVTFEVKVVEEPS